MSKKSSNQKPLTIKIYENQVFVKDFDSSAKVTYKLAGKDAKLFMVDKDGRLKFKAAPDYESPRDQGKDNTYNLTLIRESSKPIREPERQELRIEVCDKDEKSKDKGSIGDTVWFDKDGDGVRDGNEAGVAGVLVKLLSTSGKVLATTRTDANGKYLFDDLKPGSYKVKFYAPDGREFTKRSTSDPEKSGVDSDATSSGLTNVIKLGKGEKQTKVDAGLVKSDPCDASIGDTVFFDTDGDGVRDADEAGAAGVTVELLSSGGELIATTTTSANGKYIFSGLPAGNYRVKFTAPDGTEFTTRSTVGAEAVNNDSDPNAETGITGVIKLDESERQKNVDAGLVETDGGDASIGDTVWYDTNGDGLLSDGETGAAGVTVELLDSDGDVVATTTTNAAGGYVFEDLDAGDYGVRFIAPDGYEFTTASPDAADAENNDSDADTTTGETGTITLGIGETTRNVDAGLVATDSGTASLGGTVWSDTSGEGTRDGAEAGVAGVAVELLDAGGAVLATTTTDAAGDYAFENLSAGDYSVRFTAPDGTQFTTPSMVGAADADDDSDADTTTGETGTITLGIGETTRNVDAGLVATDSGTASLGGTVWSDTSGEGTRDGAEAGVAGVTVELLDAGGAVLATVTTDAAGDYAFENLSAGDYSVRFTAPDGTQFTTPSMVGAADADDDSDADTTTGETGTITLGIGETTRNVDAGLVATDGSTASIGDTVWFDTDGDGTRDGDEVGAVGVTVDLLGAGGAVVGTVVTDAAGTYLFDSLTAGDYRVRFTAPDGTAFTTSSGSGPVVADNDSDADELSGETGTISLSAGEAQTNVDAGLVLLDQGTASIGDTVWLDDNGTGTFDPGESGMSGITVDLLDSAGNVLATTQTDSNGRYLFESLTAGDYRVRFDISAWAGVYTFTSPHGGAPDANNNDSDADYSGETGLFTLSAGEAELDIDAGLQWLPWDSPPWAEPDAGEICTDMVGTIDVLVNDTDAEGPVSVVSVDGQAISEGQTITASDGVLITLNGGVLSFDPTNSDYADLLVGEHEEAIYSYTIQDTVGNMASSTVTVEYCGARNTLETIGASLPESGAIVATRDMTSDGDFYNATVSETGDARFDGLEFEAVYCLEAPDPINFDVRVPVTLHLAEQGSVPAGSVANPQNLDMVNWILNQDFDSMDNGDGTGETYTEREIQGAIWGLTDNIVFVNETVNDGTTANAQEIYDLALANGQGFTPGEGDIVGIAAVPTAEAEAAGNEQTTIIGIRYENLEQDCDCLILA